MAFRRFGSSSPTLTEAKPSLRLQLSQAGSGVGGGGWAKAKHQSVGGGSVHIACSFDDSCREKQL